MLESFYSCEQIKHYDEDLEVANGLTITESRHEKKLHDQILDLLASVISLGSVVSVK